MKEAKQLRRIASTLALLAVHAQNVHWNIKGSEFFEIHEETEKLYDKTTDFVDLVSEKLVQHNEFPPASFTEYLAETSLKEVASKRWNLPEASSIVVGDIDTLLKEVAVLDGKTNASVQPLLDEIVTFYEKFRWQFSSLVK